MSGMSPPSGGVQAEVLLEAVLGGGLDGGFGEEGGELGRSVLLRLRAYPAVGELAGLPRAPEGLHGVPCGQALV